MTRSTHAAVADDRNADVEIYINGDFFRRDEAKISVFDSGFLVGDGIWEGIRLHHGQFAFLNRHLDRLFAASKAVDLDIGTRSEVEAALRATVDRNAMHDDAHVRLMITRGDKKTPSQHPSNVIGAPNVVIIAEHKRADPTVTSHGISLFTATVRRPPPDTLDQRLNCHSKLHEVIALIQATKAGADEALMLDPTGAVATCNATNFFVVRAGELWTSTGHYNLHGITRAVVLEQARAVITGAPFDDGDASSLQADGRRKIASLLESEEITEEQAADFEKAVDEALVGDFKSSYGRLIAWVEKDLPNTDAEALGVFALPDGEAYYDRQLATFTTTDLTADEIHELGVADVARLRGEMEAVKRQVGFEGDLQAFFDYVREEPQFFYSNDDAGRQAYIDAVEERLAFINERLPEYFGILPKAELVVKRVESYREEDGAAQHYFPGTPDGSRPGIYYIHLSDMSAMPNPQLEVIAYHEGNPGHHMQNSIAQELENTPTFRTQANFGAYGEGWGLYSELLAKEMGAYEDPYSEFGRLSSEMWRALRLVVDTGLHNKGWTQQQAIDFMMQNSAEPLASVESEVQRYIVLPGQATSYKVGMIKILELRAKAETALGDKFDIGGFHDTVLGGGAVPLSVLERRIDTWISSQQ